MKFPKKIYIRREKDLQGSDFILASDTPDGEDGEKVGVYELVEVKKRRITETLV